MKLEDRLFQEAQSTWNLEKIYLQLTEVKQMGTSKTAKLTATEKAIIRGFLCGCSPKEIALRLNWSSGSLRVELTRGLYRYIETLTGHDLNSIKNWRDIVQWLEEAGYKVPQQRQDWSQLPSVSSFYGREKELIKLEEKIVRDKYQLIYAIDYIGMRETTTQAILAKWQQGKVFAEITEWLVDRISF